MATVTAGQLIRSAYQLASVVDVSQSEPEGFYSTQGIICLNEILATWGGTDGVFTPYDNNVTIPLTADNYEYVIAPVITNIEEANITLDTSPFQVLSTVQVATTQQYNLFNNTTNKGRPGYVYLSHERVVADEMTGQLGSKIVVYQTPDQNYNLNLIVKYVIQVADISASLDFLPPYYEKPLKYQLALDFSLLFKSKLSEFFPSEYQKVMDQLQSNNPLDMSIMRTNPFLQRYPFRPWNYYVY